MKNNYINFIWIIKLIFIMVYFIFKNFENSKINLYEKHYIIWNQKFNKVNNDSNYIYKKFKNKISDLKGTKKIITRMECIKLYKTKDTKFGNNYIKKYWNDFQINNLQFMTFIPNFFFYNTNKKFEFNLFKKFDKYNNPILEWKLGKNTVYNDDFIKVCNLLIGPK